MSGDARFFVLYDWAEDRWQVVEVNDRGLSVLAFCSFESDAIRIVVALTDEEAAS